MDDTPTSNELVLLEISNCLKALIAEVKYLQKMVWTMALVPVSITGLIGIGWLLANDKIAQEIMVVLVVLFVSPFYPIGERLLSKFTNGGGK